MERRDFLKTFSITGTGLAIAPLVHSENLFAESITEFDLDEATIDDLQRKMEAGKFTSQKITSMYLSRIDEIDKKGPHLLSILELNLDAMTIAKQMDDERKNGKVRGHLHGIPVLIKGNINTHDKMHTNAGATALANSIPSDDAFIVKKLRESGAVILGKTNLSEWANFRSTRSSSGWSSMLGQTRNA